jgi:TPR repeat protein
MYGMGHGAPPNIDESLKWLRKAADQGFAPAKKTFSAACGTQTAKACSKDIQERGRNYFPGLPL